MSCGPQGGSAFVWNLSSYTLNSMSKQMMAQILHLFAKDGVTNRALLVK